MLILESAFLRKVNLKLSDFIKNCTCVVFKLKRLNGSDTPIFRFADPLFVYGHDFNF